MKNFYYAVAMALLSLSLYSCDNLSEEKESGQLEWHFSEADFSAVTRSGENVPDTNEFILDVRNSAGEILYCGSYGRSPQSLMAKPGEYSISVKSSVFSEPAFFISAIW